MPYDDGDDSSDDERSKLIGPTVAANGSKLTGPAAATANGSKLTANGSKLTANGSPSPATNGSSSIANGGGPEAKHSFRNEEGKLTGTTDGGKPAKKSTEEAMPSTTAGGPEGRKPTPSGEEKKVVPGGSSSSSSRPIVFGQGHQQFLPRAVAARIKKGKGR